MIHGNAVFFDERSGLVDGHLVRVPAVEKLTLCTVGRPSDGEDEQRLESKSNRTNNFLERIANTVRGACAIRG